MGRIRKKCGLFIYLHFEPLCKTAHASGAVWTKDTLHILHTTMQHTRAFMRKHAVDGLYQSLYHLSTPAQLGVQTGV